MAELNKCNSCGDEVETLYVTESSGTICEACNHVYYNGDNPLESVSVEQTLGGYHATFSYTYDGAPDATGLSALIGHGMTRMEAYRDLLFKRSEFAA